MIAITGGLGFIGSHVTQALLDLGEKCVLVQRREGSRPDAAVEQVDLGDRAAFLDIGARHEITGIVHLAGAGPHDDVRSATAHLLTVLDAAREWGVRRVGIASTIGVYGGATGGSPYAEDTPLPMRAGPTIPALKKIGELIADHEADATGTDVVSYRIGAIWGPGGRPASPFFAAPGLVHAAVHGRPASCLADDGIDMCYARDCGRAIALLQTQDSLSHRVYNVASGRATTNGEVAAAIAEVVPDARIDVRPGRERGEPVYLDITRLRRDTGFAPEYDMRRAVADYVGWLRAGHDR
jgi:UDP-glucose 4-epimerase